MANDAGKRTKSTEIVFRKRVTRAHRYEINTGMRYRIRGAKQWRGGTVQNISISGALINADFMEMGTAIELSFSLPVHLQSESAAEVFCRGSVIRSSKSDDPDEAALVAVKIEHWRFLRQKDSKSDSPDIFRTAGF